MVHLTQPVATTPHRPAASPASTEPSRPPPPSLLDQGRALVHRASRIASYNVALVTGMAHPSVPHLRGSPLLGLLPQLCERGNDAVLESLYALAEGRGLAYGWIATRPIYILRDPALIRQVFVQQAANVSRVSDTGTAPFDTLKRLVGDSTFTAQGKTWQRLRGNLLSEFFAVSGLRGKFAEVHAISGKHVEALTAAGVAADLRKVASAYALEAIWKVTLGIDGMDAYNEELSGGLQHILTLAASPAHAWRHVMDALKNFRSLNELDDEEKVARAEFDALVERLVLSVHGDKLNPEAEGPLTPVQMVSKLTGGTADRPLTEETLSQIRLVVVGGHETTGLTLSWALYELGRHPAVAAKIREELRAHGAEATASFEGLAELKYLEAVLEETLRLHPPVPFAARETKTDIDLLTQDGVVQVYAGAQVIVPTRHLHQDVEIWGSDAAAFRPERFVGRNRHALIQAAELMSFSTGPRRCPGFHLSLLEAKLFLARLLGHHDIILTDDRPVGNNIDSVLRPASAIPARIVAVSDSRSDTAP
ncbi:MAG TPA: cytochrome P450 [Myxococcota bacterium]|nr:cytochrome P450 [Myxococcota bacterium]